MEFREALHYGAQGASEFNDVLGAGRYLRGRPDVDPKRIGLWGGSYGGVFTAMGVAPPSDPFSGGGGFARGGALEKPNPKKGPPPPPPQPGEGRPPPRSTPPPR